MYTYRSSILLWQGPSWNQYFTLSVYISFLLYCVIIINDKTIWSESILQTRFNWFRFQDPFFSLARSRSTYHIYCVLPNWLQYKQWRILATRDSHVHVTWGKLNVGHALNYHNSNVKSRHLPPCLSTNSLNSRKCVCVLVHLHEKHRAAYQKQSGVSLHNLSWKGIMMPPLLELSREMNARC